MTRYAQGNLPIPHTSGQIPHAGKALQIAAQEGALPSLSHLYKTTHQHSDGKFIVPKKRGRMVGIGTVNDVSRARAEYAARMRDNSQLQTDLTAANRVISELRGDNQTNRTHIRSIAGMFDVLAETNPALAAMWQNVRPTINPDPTLEEQTDLEQRSVHHSAEIFDDINLNN
ncbi:hypothetical protein F2Q68_00031006 [Brassica cretica]|uniref:Uncharacterized protein n=1 Tax=Brassica cretica TaxID=69181 RepID=A0A8S9G544_BRACR|nr:hypothetical protein F2Q68_00031006 [Brassica cretica]